MCLLIYRHSESSILTKISSLSLNCCKSRSLAEAKHRTSMKLILENEEKLNYFTKLDLFPKKNK